MKWIQLTQCATQLSQPTISYMILMCPFARVRLTIVFFCFFSCVYLVEWRNRNSVNAKTKHSKVFATRHDTTRQSHLFRMIDGNLDHRRLLSHLWHVRNGHDINEGSINNGGWYMLNMLRDAFPVYVCVCRYRICDNIPPNTQYERSHYMTANKYTSLSFIIDRWNTRWKTIFGQFMRMNDVRTPYTLAWTNSGRFFMRVAVTMGHKKILIGIAVQQFLSLQIVGR